jgi:hypothetical protein
LEKRDSEKGGMIYELLAYQGARFGLYAALKNSVNQTIGYVSIKKDESFSEDDFLLVRDIAKEIALLLS